MALPIFSRAGEHVVNLYTKRKQWRLQGAVVLASYNDTEGWIATKSPVSCSRKLNEMVPNSALTYVGSDCTQSPRVTDQRSGIFPETGGPGEPAARSG